MADIIPIQKARDKRAEAQAAVEFTETATPVDIRTSQLPMRVVDDNGQLRLYPAVLIDAGIDDEKVTRARKFRAEPLAMSGQMAEFFLMALYGPDSAARMLRDADRGDYVFGQQAVHDGVIRRRGEQRQRNRSQQ